MALPGCASALLRHVGFGAVDEDWSGDAGGDFFENGGDVAFLVFATMAQHRSSMCEPSLASFFARVKMSSYFFA